MTATLTQTASLNLQSALERVKQARPTETRGRVVQLIGLVVESQCQYQAPLAYPTPIVAGLRVDRLGNRAVTYGLAIFAEGDDHAAAHGHVVHVFVDRATRRPVEIPPAIRSALARITA